MSKGLVNLAKAVETKRKGLASPRALASKIRAEMVVGNRDARNRGVDANGKPLKPISLATRESREQRGLGNGPPLNPGGRSEAEVIRKFFCEPKPASGREKARLTFGFKIQWIQFHLKGGKRLPKRDISGIPAVTRRRIGKLIKEFFAGVLR